MKVVGSVVLGFDSAVHIEGNYVRIPAGVFMGIRT